MTITKTEIKRLLKAEASRKVQNLRLAAHDHFSSIKKKEELLKNENTRKEPKNE